MATKNTTTTPPRLSGARRVSTFTDKELLLAQATSYTRFQMCRIETGDDYYAAKLFVERWPNDLYAGLLLKAATSPGTTLEPSWAAPLAAVRPMQQRFIALAMAETFPSRLSKLGARSIPLQVSTPAVSAGGTYRFVGQGQARAG